MGIANFIIENYSIEECVEWANCYRNLYSELGNVEFMYIAASILDKLWKTNK